VCNSDSTSGETKTRKKPTGDRKFTRGRGVWENGQTKKDEKNLKRRETRVPLGKKDEFKRQNENRKQETSVEVEKP